MTNLAVHMGGQLVGTLEAANRRSLRFTYDPDYAAGSGSTPLSVSMPLRVSPYLHATVHPYLWGLLPDNDRVLERWAREFGCAPTDVAGLLWGVGGDVAGAAQYVATRTTPEESQPGEVEWLSDDDVAQFLRDLRRDTTTWRPHPQGRWSLAGAQAKMALLYDQSADRWGIPSGATPTTHIIKPAIGGLDDFDMPAPGHQMPCHFEKAASVATIKTTHPGMSGKLGCITPATVHAVSAPNISTSPCAKLISWMMP